MTMEDFVKKYKLVFVTATLKSLPTQVSKEFLQNQSLLLRF